MSAAVRRYLVFGRDGTSIERMVLTQSKASAIAHVAGSMLDARVATPDDIERLVAAGVRSETPGASPQAELPIDE